MPILACFRNCLKIFCSNFFEFVRSVVITTPHALCKRWKRPQVPPHIARRAASFQWDAAWRLKLTFSPLKPTDTSWDRKCLGFNVGPRSVLVLVWNPQVS